LWTVFTDFLDFSLLLLKWYDCKQEYFEELEKRYPDKEQHELFVTAYAALPKMAEGFRDPFGNYFMEHFSSDHAGQFFTPEHVCDMMTIVTLEGLEDGKSVLDPCCGSGRFMLSAGKVNRNLRFYNADIDLTCVKMTLINMMLQSLRGQVAHMDSLSKEMWRAYQVDLIPHDGHLLPMYMEIPIQRCCMYEPPRPKSEPKPFNPKTPPAGKAVQTSLF